MIKMIHLIKSGALCESDWCFSRSAARNLDLGYNNLTLGSNQRLEFLGDTVLQLITSDFLYKVSAT
jgi:dsRNA-specific ribonuclease